MGLLSFAGDLIGGIMGRSSADAAKDANMEINANNIALQREFAQQGIQWRVEDAKKAGIHPLYALGAQTHSFTPSAIGVDADYSMANAMQSAGQNLDRAVQATMTGQQRHAVKMQQLTEERGELENALLKSQIAREQANANPNFPGSPGMLDGQGNVVIIPKEVVANDGPYEKGVSPAHQTLQFGPGKITAMSQALSDAGLDDGPAQWYYQLSRTIPGMIASDARQAYSAYMRSGTRAIRKFMNKKWQPVR